MAGKPIATATAKAAAVQTLPISIQGKQASISFDDELVWLNRATTAHPTTPTSDVDRAYLCIPHALVLHCSFIADADGGSLLLRLLAPPTGADHLTKSPFKKTRTRASRVVEMRRSLDQDGVHQPRRRLAAQLSGPCTNLRLLRIEARLAGQDANASIEEADAWAQHLMALAYQGIRPYRRFRVVINPIGGPGKAVQLFQSRVLPILDAAGCTVNATVTTHPFHGQEIAQSLDLADGYDGILCVSGDGMLHEVLNGLAQHPQAAKALQIPMVPIPAGSANAVALNLLGVEEGFNLALASLNAIKGRIMPVDVCCFTQPLQAPDAVDAKPLSPKEIRRKSLQKVGSSTASLTQSAAGQSQTQGVESTNGKFDVGYSFLSQAIGLMADVDLGTEHLRMLGDTRFVLGFIGGVLTNKECEVDVYVRFGQSGTINKADMRARVQARSAKALNGDLAPENGQDAHVEAVSNDIEDAKNPAGQGSKLRTGSVMDPFVDHVPDLVPIDPSWPKTLLAPVTPNGQTSPGTVAVDAISPTEWYRIKAPISALYGGKAPFVSRDLLQFPFALSDDHCIDLALMLHGGGRMAKLRGISGAETGIVVYDPAMVYLKCEAYRVVPRLEAGHPRLKGGGLLSIDGEHKPYRPFQVEVDDQVQMRFFSLFGQWLTPDVPPPGTATSAPL